MFQDIGSSHQSTGKRIHTTDMSQKNIIQIGRVTTCLGIEVRTSGSQAACFEDNQPSLCQFVDVNRELIRIPTILIITTVGIDTAQHTGIGGSLKFMLKCMPGQCGMVHFDINGKILVETIMAQEADNRFRIHVILVFSRFHRFRLYQESSFEPVLAGIVTCHRQHHGKMFLFAFHIGVQQAHIAFTSPPEHIVFAT